MSGNESMTVGEAIGIFGKIATLEAEVAGLAWAGNAARILEASTEADLLRNSLGIPARDQLDVQGMYMHMEDFTALFAVGDPPPVRFAYHALDYLAREGSQEFGLAACENWRMLTSRLGSDIVDPMMDVLIGMMGNFRQEYRRSEISERPKGYDGPLTAPIGCTDTLFEEASFVECDADAEHATLISIADIYGGWDDLREFIEKRDIAARRALRGETVQ